MPFPLGLGLKKSVFDCRAGEAGLAAISPSPGLMGWPAHPHRAHEGQPPAQSGAGRGHAVPTLPLLAPSGQCDREVQLAGPRQPDDMLDGHARLVGEPFQP
ncbi:hypothetical protein NJB1507_40830 [Mycobacterium marinum]|nr:hypothetical protein NJB1507_40830 [Mycobacterium marinum]